MAYMYSAMLKSSLEVVQVLAQTIGVEVSLLCLGVSPITAGAGSPAAALF